MQHNIITTYSFRRQDTKINRSKYVDRAILNCIYHMQRNDYCASIAQVSCGITGKLYAVITRNITGKIRIVYEDDSGFVKTDDQYQTIPQPTSKLKLAYSRAA